MLDAFSNDSTYPDGLFESLLSSTRDGVLAFDGNLKVTFWNSAMVRISGVPTENAIGKNVLDIFSFLRRTDEVKYFTAALEGKTCFSVGRKYGNPAINENVFDTVYAPIYNSSRTITGGSVIIRDTTRKNLAEKAKDRAEHLLQSLTKISQDALITCDENGTIRSWSDSAETLFGYVASEAVGQDLGIILPPKYWIHFLPKYLKTASQDTQSSNTQTLEFFAQRKGGSNIPVKVVLSDWTLERKSFLSITIRDMTDPLRLQNLAEELQEFYEGLLSAQSDLKEGVAVSDLTSQKFIFVNDAFCEMLKYSRAELLEMDSIFNIISPEQLPLHTKRIERIINGNTASDHYESAFTSKLGEKVFVDIAVKPIETSDRRATICLVRDVTLKKKTEQNLMSSERQMGFLMNSVEDLIGTLSLDGIITSVNVAVEKIFGFKQEEFIGRNAFDFLHPDDIKKSKREFENILQGKSVSRQEMRMRTVRGDFVTVESSIAPLLDHGKITGTISVMRDVSERINQQKALADEHARYEAIALATFEGLVFTKDGVLIDASDTFVKMFGYEKLSEVIGMRGEQFGTVEFQEHIRERLDQNVESHFHFTALKKDKTTFECDVSAKLYNYRGQLCRVASIRYRVPK
jgi:PAS domain S-box-containing protein